VFRHDCAERENGFVAMSNCFAGGRRKKQSAGRDERLAEKAAGTGAKL
jgi:hypothetical protein